MTGRSMLGSSRISTPPSAAMPATTIRRLSTIASTGRLTNSAAKPAPRVWVLSSAASDIAVLLPGLAGTRRRPRYRDRRRVRAAHRLGRVVLGYGIGGSPVAAHPHHRDALAQAEDALDDDLVARLE